MNKHMDMAAAWGSSCKIIDSRHIAQSFKKDPELFRDLELDIFFPSQHHTNSRHAVIQSGPKHLTDMAKGLLTKD
jgi:hypothetical protein